jgi:hypothetical protein
MKSPLGLAAIALVSLAGCADVPAPKPDAVCPSFPQPSPEVADELSAIGQTAMPHTWDWLARLETLDDQLGACCA